MTNPLQSIRDRRKPWQKTLKTLKLAKCGAMLAESARGWGTSLAASDRDLNCRGGRYGEKPSEREVQYWLHMTGQNCPHHANLGGRDITIDRQAAEDWLAARALA